MFNVLDGVINTNRFDVDVADGVITSGIEGLWVAPQTTGKYDFEAGAAIAYAIFTESNNDGTVGFTEDAVYLKKVAVLSGTYRALTNQYDGTPAAGDYMITTSAGKLAVSASAGANVVAVCLKAPHTVTHLGSSVTVIEIQAITTSV